MPEKIEKTIPPKPLLRVDEVAAYFDVSKSVIYLWIDNGLLEAEKYQGTIRIPRDSVVNFRLKSKIMPLS
jgi:excisionase family DNA binding protein